MASASSAISRASIGAPSARIADWIELIKAVKKDDPADFGLLRARARSGADIMLGDVSSWRLSAESRGLAIPG